MPSLRQTTTKRTSRTSSPFVRTANTSPAPPTEPQRKERAPDQAGTWVEPTPKSPVPSFQEYGMERTALFQDMAPLGSMPPTRLKLRVKGDFRPEKAESLPASDTAVGTPEGTPPAEVKSSSQPASEEPVKEEEDTIMNDAPEPKPERLRVEIPDEKVVVPPPQVQSPLVQNRTPTPAHSRQTSISRASNTAQSPSGRTAAQQKRDKRNHKMDQIVKKAVDMAKESGQPKLALVIARFYEETHNNPTLGAIFDAVIKKNETPEQKLIFSENMKRIRKAVKIGLDDKQPGGRQSLGSIPPGHSGSPTIAPPQSTMASPSIGPGPPPSMGFFQPAHLSRALPQFSPNFQQVPSPFNTYRAAGTQSSPYALHPLLNRTLPPNFTELNPHQHPSIPAQAQYPPASAQSPSQPRPFSQSPSLSQSPALATPQALPTPKAQQSDSDIIMVSTRRQVRAAAAGNANAATPASNAAASASSSALPTAAAAQPEKEANPVKPAKGAVQHSVPLTNGTKKSSAAKPKIKIKGGPTVGKGRKETDADVGSATDSPLSSSDEDIEEPAELDIVLQSTMAALPAPTGSRVGSRSATPRPGPLSKAKPKKGSNLKNFVGQKRAANEILVEVADPETENRRKIAKTNLDRQLRERKSEQPLPRDYESFRESEEYVGAVSENAEASGYNPRRRGSRPGREPEKSRNTPTTRDIFKKVPTAPVASKDTTAAATAPSTRRTREANQNKRSIIDITADVPTLEVKTPSTPSAHQETDAESNGDPPPKRRKNARTKYSPTKLPNGVPPSRRTSSRGSSPSVDGGRPGKKPNRDQCYACGCGGNLICCDMCQNAFHAECWDPPCHDAADEPFQGPEWICTHCAIWDRLKENEERSRRGEALLLDSDDDYSVADSEEIETPIDWTLQEPVSQGINFIKDLKKAFTSVLPQQFSIPEIVRDAYDGYQVDIERRYKPVRKAPVTVDSRVRPYESIFDDGKQIKNPDELKHCAQCGLTAVSKKGDIIKCDHIGCGLFWHIDCIDTPTTAPPQTWSTTEKRGNRMVEVYKKRYWECPRHVDQDIVLLTDPQYYGSEMVKQRATKVRLPKSQIAQVAALRNASVPQESRGTKRTREMASDKMLVNIKVNDDWWEKFDARVNEMKECNNKPIELDERTILANFAAKARTDRFLSASTNEEVLDAVLPRAYMCEPFKQKWRAREQARIDRRVAEEAEVVMTLAGMRQATLTAPPDLLAEPSDVSAVARLAGVLTKEQIRNMQQLLENVNKHMDAQPDTALATKAAELDADMAAILAGSKPSLNTDYASPGAQAVQPTGAPVAEQLDEDDNAPPAKRLKTDTPRIPTPGSLTQHTP